MRRRLLKPLTILSPLIVAAAVPALVLRASGDPLPDDEALPFVSVPVLCVSIAMMLRFDHADLGRTIGRDLGRCPSCGYSLKGNASGVCPECGHPIDGVAGAMS